MRPPRTAPRDPTPAPAPAEADRQQRRFAERDRRIREAAQTLLLERGLHGFSMDDVADAIDYSKGTVYQHYTNKEDALVAACVDSCSEVATRFERAAALPGRPRERMAAIAEAYCAFVREKPVSFRVIPQLHSPTVFEKVAPERLRAMDATRGRSLAACGGVVRDAIACGDLVLPKGMRPEAVTFSLWALMFGAFFLAELHRPEGILGIQDPTDMILASWAAHMDGLGWRPAAKRAPKPAARRPRPSRRPQRSGGRGAVAALLAALALAVTAACGRSGEPPPMEMPPAPVTTAVAVAKDVPRYLDEIGRCVASEVVTILPQVSGKITDIPFADGADLAPKAHLFTIDPRPYEAREAEARARAAAATADVTEARAARNTAAARVGTAKSKREEARAQSAAGQAMAEAARGDTTSAQSEATRTTDDLKRMESMSGSGAISQQELVRSRTEASAAEARVAAAKRREAAAVAQATERAAAEKSAEDAIREAESQLAEADARILSAEADEAEATAAIEPARLDVEFCTIRSPIVGRAGRRLVDVGNVVTARTTPLLSIQRVDPVHVEFTVTEQDLSAVQASLRRGTLKAEVRLPPEERAADPNAAAEARTGDVVFLDNAVQEGTGTIRLRVQLGNADGRFWPGRFARVRLLLDTLEDAVLVPATAPQASAMGSFVYVVEATKDPKTGAEQQVAAMRPIVLGQRHGDLVAIEKGVAAGDRVIVERQFFVYPGAKVAVIPPAQPPGAQASAAAGAGAAQ